MSITVDGKLRQANIDIVGTGSFGYVSSSLYLAATMSINEGLGDFVVWESGSGDFKRRTSGATGTSGTAGSGGTSGTAGSGGSSGTSGTAGSGGTSGTAGSGGSSGTSGTAGSGGSSGTSGTAGSGGSSGTSGTAGSGGSSGTSGTAGSGGTSGIDAATGIWADSGSYIATTHNVQITGSLGVNGEISASGLSLDVMSPMSLSLVEYTTYVDIFFTASATPNINNYEIWRAETTASNPFGLIGLIKQDSIVADSNNIADATYTISGSVFYKIFAVKNGIYSSPLSGSIDTVYGCTEASALRVFADTNRYYLSYTIPDDPRFDSVQIKVDNNAVFGSLDEATAVLCYNGGNSHYIYEVSASDLNNFHQFWVYTITRE